jgi:hypothetical protein
MVPFARIGWLKVLYVNAGKNYMKQDTLYYCIHSREKWFEHVFKTKKKMDVTRSIACFFSQNLHPEL